MAKTMANPSVWWMGIMLLGLVLSPAKTVGSLDCSSLLNLLDPCTPFLKCKSEIPEIECCGGVLEVANIVLSSKENIKAACYCFKDAGKKLPVPSLRVKELLSICNVDFNMTMSPSIDCSKL